MYYFKLCRIKLMFSKLYKLVCVYRMSSSMFSSCLTGGVQAHVVKVATRWLLANVAVNHLKLDEFRN